VIFSFQVCSVTSNSFTSSGSSIGTSSYKYSGGSSYDGVAAGFSFLGSAFFHSDLNLKSSTPIASPIFASIVLWFNSYSRYFLSSWITLLNQSSSNEFLPE